MTLLWCKSNAETAASLIGLFTWRPRQFEFDTGLDAEEFHKTLRAVPGEFYVHEDKIWLRNYIAEQFGGDDGLTQNRNLLKGLARRLEGLPRGLKGLQEAIKDSYPVLKGLTTPLQPTLRGLQPPPSGLPGSSDAEGEALEQIPTGPKGDQMLLDPKGLPTPSEGVGSLRAEQSRTEQNRSSPSGESEGGAPPDKLAVDFARAWPGDPERGIPAGMPDGYVLKWLSWRTGKNGAFPKDWRVDLVRQFTADWIEGRQNTRPPALAKGEKPAGPDKAALVSELAKCTDAARRKELLKLLKNAA